MLFMGTKLIRTHVAGCHSIDPKSARLLTYKAGQRKRRKAQLYQGGGIRASDQMTSGVGHMQGLASRRSGMV